MRKTYLAALFLLVFLAGPSLAQEIKYSIREVGFVEVEAKPYRLIVLAKDLDAPAVKKQQAALKKEFANSNIVLVAQTADAKTVGPDKKPINNMTGPLFWLIAPDDRFIPFTPGVALGDLVRSPLRETILHDVTQSLCAVVLLESKDEGANRAAADRANAVLRQVNDIRGKLARVPDHDIELRVLPVADRPKERWTLWGLGEDVAAPETPKIAVIFGKMRRAGPLFEGTAWSKNELFGRIVLLAQECEDDKDRQEFFGPALPFQWPSEWAKDLGLLFDPHKEEVKKEVALLLQRPPLEFRIPRKLTFDDFAEPLVIPAMGAREEVVQREGMPGIVASQVVTLGLFAAGILGWIALGLSVLYLEGRHKT